MPDVDLLLLVGVLLPPRALDGLGPVVEERVIHTPYGNFGPVARRSAPHLPGIWLAPYTGLPTRTDPRATLFAANQLGVRRVLGWDTGIALNRALMRGQAVISGDFIDFTFREPNTFASNLVREQQEGRPMPIPRFCPQMTTALQRVLPIAPQITYLGIDDLRRETPAEARMYRLWGADIIGQNLVYGADQPVAVFEGELRAGLEMVMQVLPEYMRYLAMMPDCTCIES
jgi:hypothetical protein